MTRTVAAFVALALMTGCSKGSQKPPAPPAPHVSVGQPLARDVVDWDEYIGRFQAPQSVDLRARITGVVTQILFKDGQDVKQGQPLFIIDPRPYRATLEQAEAQIASARASLSNAISVQDRSAKAGRRAGGEQGRARERPGDGPYRSRQSAGGDRQCGQCAAQPVVHHRPFAGLGPRFEPARVAGRSGDERQIRCSPPSCRSIRSGSPSTVPRASI